MPTNKPQRLPDAMPDVEKPTLLVVCDTHHCKFIDVGNHTLLVSGTIDSKEADYSDKEGQYQSSTGVIGGMADTNPTEKNRLHEFANDVATHLAHVVQAQKIEEVYVSAPNKFLGELKKHIAKPVQKLIQKMVDGNFAKESPLEVLLRFRPDLEQARQALRDEENYSPKNQPPKKAKKK